MPPHLQQQGEPSGDVAGTPADAGTGSSREKTDTAVAGPARPSESAPKSEWVDYASSESTPDHLSREEASGMTKNALMEMFT
jgi:hypothetical protein